MPDSRAGLIDLTLLKGNAVAVVFETPMPDANYVVMIQQQGKDLAQPFWISVSRRQGSR